MSKSVWCDTWSELSNAIMEAAAAGEPSKVDALLEKLDGALLDRFDEIREEERKRFAAHIDAIAVSVAAARLEVENV